MNRTLCTFFACLIALAAGRVEAIDLTATGNLAAGAIPAAALVAAGTRPVGTYEYPSSTGLDVTLTKNKRDNWSIEVRHSTTSWPPAVKLWVKRSSNGIGAGTLSGGEIYQEVTASNRTLCSGAGDRSGISLAFQLTGLSLLDPPGSYHSSALFTVVDTP